MRRGGASVLVMLIVCLGGCLTGDPERPSTVSQKFRGTVANLGPDGVLLDIVLIERPLGDTFLNDELWSSTDCQVVGLETKSLLDNNGFRVGQVIGMNPGKLQNLLVSERFCIPVRKQILPAGTSTSVMLGPVLPHCNYRVKLETGVSDTVVDEGQCSFNIIPSLTNDGRTRLKFTPQVLYGAELPDYQVATDRSGPTGFQYQRKRQSKTYEALSWEVTLSPNQYIVVGTRFDENASDAEPQSLGNQSFLIDNGRGFNQRVLVIRTSRAATGQDAKSNEKGPAMTDRPMAPAAFCLQRN